MEKEIYEEIKQKANYCLNCKNAQCIKACPLGNNIPEFINKIKEEDYKGAFDVLSKTTIMEPICGLICPHEKQCQGSCIRGLKGEAVHIGELEAFIGRLAIENKWYMYECNQRSNKKVAVIGGGPAGISCSAHLAQKGYDVTIYEKYDKLGGLLIHGIPEFRLERKLVENWIKQILDLGIKVKYNKALGNNLRLDELEKDNDAVFICIGANKSIKLGVEGENLEGVYGANELLETNNHPDYKGKKVAIIGGGNVALDIARTVNKLGAKKIYIIYRRAEKQMPAERKEIEDAKLEGIDFLFQNNIVKIIGKEKVEGIELIKTKLIKKEGEAREIPLDIVNSNYKLDVDYIIRAIGSTTENKEIFEGISLNNKNYIEVNENYKTSEKIVFAGGDVIGTKATVAYAARTGIEAAKKIDEFFEKI